MKKLSASALKATLNQSAKRGESPTFRTVPLAYGPHPEGSVSRQWVCGDKSLATVVKPTQSIEDADRALLDLAKSKGWLT